MNNNAPTLAIYGIQDQTHADWPSMVHDHSMALYHQGKLIKFLQLERLSRKKRDNTLHKQIYTLLKHEGLLAGQYDLVFVDNVLGRAFISEQGNLRFEGPLVDRLASDIEVGVAYWLNERQRAYVLNHELSHVHSCLPFFGSFKENSLLVHFDGGASQSNFSAWHWSHGKINLLENHWSLKYLSNLFNANALNFAILGASAKDQHSVPGKLMGFASYGEYSCEIEQWLIRHEYFENHWRSKKIFFEKAKNDFGYQKNYLDQKEKFIQDVVATVQTIFSRDVLKKLETLQQQTQTDYLYYTGGCALSIVTNSQIVKAGFFKEIFIPPCAEDSGLALGAGAFLEYQKHGFIERHSPYLNNWGIKQAKVVYDQSTIEQVAELILQNKVIGICNGFGEVGPRALGNRSIIALANSVTLAKTVSQTHKGREWYRPIAPVIRQKNLEYFIGSTKRVDNAPSLTLSQYMLMDFQVLPERREELAGVVHVNGTARIQTIDSNSENVFLYDLLDFLEQEHGIRALINTSFNHRSEPIVHQIEDALSAAKHMKLDAVVLNGQLAVLV